MATRRLLQLLLIFLLAGVLSGTVAPAPSRPAHLARANARSSVSSPRQSLPAPVHDESICAFCQAAAFAPHAASSTCGLAELAGAEPQEHISPNDRPGYAGSLSPTRSRAPPVLREG
jgi:hypothetical protein